MSISAWIAYTRAAMGIMHGNRAFGGPIQANISLTNRCNIRCIHCYYNSPLVEKPTLPSLRRARLTGKEQPDAGHLKSILRLEADTDRTNKLLNELIRMGTKRYQLSGHGETFLHKDTLEIMDRLKHAGCYCLTNTNGTLLDRHTIDELIKMKFDDLRITVMAGNPEMYMRTHPGIHDDTFYILRDNLRYLAERKAASGVKYPEITLVFIAVRHNFDGIFEFAEFAADVDADRVQYRPVDDVDDPGLANLILTEEQADSVRKQLPEAKAFLESRQIIHNISNFQKVFRKKLDTKALYRTIPCYYGWLTSLIDVKGEVYPCCRCYEPLGNVHDNPFHEIWNGDAYCNFRNQAVQINKRKTSANGCNCNSCVNYSANLRVYKLLHPVKGRSDRLIDICSAFSGQENK